MEGKVSSSKNNDVLDKGEGKNIPYKNWGNNQLLGKDVDEILRGGTGYYTLNGGRRSNRERQCRKRYFHHRPPNKHRPNPRIRGWYIII